MTRSDRPWARATCLALLLLFAPDAAKADPRRDADADWRALHERSRHALATLAGTTDCAAQPNAPPCRTIVIGFTGGLEGQNSRVSGVVRLQRSIDEHFAGMPGLTARAYSNFKWRQAADDVRALVERLRRESSAGGAHAAQPLILVYGHSWGAGAIGKFARELARHDLDVALAVYIDAFTLRNPRVPANVHYAVNLYQRTGVLRGLPLRGKKRLVAVSPDDTAILGSLRIRPETTHFGWNWNLVQPLLYRHHHRIGHDVRIRDLLLGLVELHVAAGHPTGN